MAQPTRDAANLETVCKLQADQLAQQEAEIGRLESQVQEIALERDVYRTNYRRELARARKAQSMLGERVLGWSSPDERED